MNLGRGWERIVYSMLPVVSQRGERIEGFAYSKWSWKGSRGHNIFHIESYPRKNNGNCVTSTELLYYTQTEVIAETVARWRRGPLLMRTWFCQSIGMSVRFKKALQIYFMIVNAEMITSMCKMKFDWKINITL